MQATVFVDKETANIRLVGTFNHAVHRPFKEATRPALANADVKELLIDMSNVERIDSSALGLLLVTRDEAKKAGKTMSLKGAQGVTKRALDMAQFERLFAFK
ncbi:MAG: STAS domain-containing protein [Sterolibacteriaceae bacterium MAG5]|nr:STAS domain-containing protein [Candidatus Nitricoxidireducens bremensis]